jgi:hypothetical protein
VCASRRKTRHVTLAFGLAHLAATSGWTRRYARALSAVERRHDALRHTDGLNEEVFDALVLLAAGSWQPAEIASGLCEGRRASEDMDRGRRQRLEKLGFPPTRRGAFLLLHTRNFM